MYTIPLACMGVKCMQKDCISPASHKVGELNIFDAKDQPESYNAFNERHELTTYLCDEHFDLLMNREELYFKDDTRF